MSFGTTSQGGPKYKKSNVKGNFEGDYYFLRHKFPVHSPFIHKFMALAVVSITIKHVLAVFWDTL